MENSVVKKICCSALVLLLSACGGDDENVPVGATVEVSPSEKVWNSAPDLEEDQVCIVRPDNYQDELVTIRVADSNGRALGDVEVIASLNLTANTSGDNVQVQDENGNAIFSMISLYDDKNGDFIADENELVSGVDDPILFTKTDEYNGTKTLIVRMNLSCRYRAILQVIAAGTTGNASFSVTTDGG